MSNLKEQAKEYLKGKRNFSHSGTALFRKSDLIELLTDFASQQSEKHEREIKELSRINKELDQYAEKLFNDKQKLIEGIETVMNTIYRPKNNGIYIQLESLLSNEESEREESAKELIEATTERYPSMESTESKETDWISVKDRLPCTINEFNESETVLTFDDEYNTVGMAYIDEGEWMNNENSQRLGNEVNITHWQPLPKPPVKE